jgi:hypothetical protein
VELGASNERVWPQGPVELLLYAYCGSGIKELKCGEPLFNVKHMTTRG